MALIIEDSQKVTQRKIPVPKESQKVFSALYNALEPNMGKNSLKNLKNLATDKTYNKKGNTTKTNGKEQGVNYVNIDVAKMRKSRWPNDPLQQMAQGGQLAYNLYDKGIERARSQEKVSLVEPPKPTSDADTKPNNVKVKKIELPSGTISYNEGRVINEGYDESVFYDYLNEYNALYVFKSFMENPKGKQNWGALINPDMYAKALREFTKYGKLIKFPSKYVYQWMGIIMKNTAILCSNTEIAGHSTVFPYDEYEDFLLSFFGNDRKIDVELNGSTKIEITPDEVLKLYNNDTIVEGVVDKYGQTYFPWVSQDYADRTVAAQDLERQKSKFSKMYEEIGDYIAEYNNNKRNRDKIEVDYKTCKIFWVLDCFELLDKIGLYDWMKMPDGSDAFSDFGIEPLLRILKEYNEDLPLEKVLVLVNKALDIYHQRGDMASIFIQGGSNILSKIAEEVEISSKKIYITEKQIINLKNG